MSDPSTHHCDRTGGCIVCGDAAAEMTVLALDPERGLALCSDPGGGRSSVETALVEPVAVGERLLVHAGTAIGRDAGPAAAPGPGGTA